jgi:hypothetical protein
MTIRIFTHVGWKQEESGHVLNLPVDWNPWTQI